jgi:hypothetical protein
MRARKLRATAVHHNGLWDAIMFEETTLSDGTPWTIEHYLHSFTTETEALNESREYVNTCLLNDFAEEMGYL